ncbi:hypothetical protein AC249_AIPGENE535 [Exaiptasia diaphana]|nr:hypothetical protein AC249_AIPGENE535 [Exaiptasia diaphana]
MLEKDKIIDSTKDPGFTNELEQLTESISYISFDSKKDLALIESKRSSLSSEFSELETSSLSSSTKWDPQLMEEIYSELNNNQIGSSIIERGNRAKLRRSSSSLSRNKRPSRTVSDPVRSVIPKVEFKCY